MLWALIFSGGLAPPAGRFSPVQWHAHEMFFGFGWAVLGGFLLTATKNWVQVRGYHGTALVGLVLADLPSHRRVLQLGKVPSDPHGADLQTLQ